MRYWRRTERKSPADGGEDLTAMRYGESTIRLPSAFIVIPPTITGLYLILKRCLGSLLLALAYLEAFNYRCRLSTANRH